MRYLLPLLFVFIAACAHTQNGPSYSVSDKTKTQIKHDMDKNAANFWFYIRESSGGFYDQKGVHYSQVLECSQRVTTPGAFAKIHAVGPFDDYLTALLVRRDELDLAREAGKKLIQRTAVCDTRWD